MLIYGQGGKNIIPWDKVTEVSAGDTTVFVSLIRTDTQAGKYTNKEQTRFAVEMLATAVMAEEPYFEFPSVADIEDMMATAKQRGSKVSSRKRSHGGS